MDPLPSEISGGFYNHDFQDSWDLQDCYFCDFVSQIAILLILWIKVIKVQTLFDTPRNKTHSSRPTFHASQSLGILNKVHIRVETLLNAFENLNLHKVYAHVLVNHPAYKTWIKMGAKVEGTLIEHYYNINKYENVSVLAWYAKNFSYEK